MRTVPSNRVGPGTFITASTTMFASTGGTFLIACVVLDLQCMSAATQTRFRPR